MPDRFSLETFSDENPKLWVGPQGSDTAKGTYEAPLASIQTAIDRLDDRFALEAPKEIRVFPGTYAENLFINTKNLTLRGLQPANASTLDSNRPHVQIEDDDPSLPVMTVANASRAGWEAFEADGGVEFSWNGSSFSYTGASLARELRHTESEVGMGVVVKNLTMWHRNARNSKANNLQILGFPNPDHNNEVTIETVYLERLQCIDTSSGANAYFKNYFPQGKALSESKFIPTGAFFVLDRSNVGVGAGQREGIRIDSMLARGGTTATADEGAPPNDQTFGDPRAPFFVELVEAYYLGSMDFCPSHGGQTKQLHVDVDEAGEFLWASSGQFGHRRNPQDLACSIYDHTGSGNMNIRHLWCREGNHAGSGKLRVQRIECFDSAGFEVSGGASNNWIYGGTIEGDLVISSGTDIELRGVTIEGNLDVDSQDTTVHCKGCHVQGDVQQEDVSGSQITFDGGAIMGSTPSPSTATFSRNTGS